LKKEMFKKMANGKAVEFMSGRLFWAKVTGAPVPNYGGDAREWTFEFEPDEAGIAILKKHKLLDRLKEKEDAKNPDKGRFLVLRKKEFAANGDANKPIRIYDADDNPWDGSLIGNGSAADVKIDIRDYGAGKKKGVYPVAIRVTEPVEYQATEFGRMDAADEAEEEEAPVKAKRKPALKFDPADLDDDIPF
jgi:hypothetical protein